MEQKHLKDVYANFTWNKTLQNSDTFHLLVKTTTLSDLAPFLGDGLFLANTPQPITEDFPPLTHHHKSSIRHDMQTLRQIIRRGVRTIPCV